MGIVIDSNLRSILKKIYSDIENNGGEVSVSSPDYKQTQIDVLVAKGLVSKIDASALDGWEYILRPTYEGEIAIMECSNTLKSKVDEFINRGIDIGNKESHTSAGPYHITSVSGPMYDKWMGEINIFNERHLINHPLHDSIYTTYFHRKYKPSSYDDMMGHLRALSADEEFLGQSSNTEKETSQMINDSVVQMLKRDIDRCNSFLENPFNDSVGVDIYEDITSKYDSIIPNLGNGLYQYYADQHFYDPEISGDTLSFNLKNLKNKMVSYLTLNYPDIAKVAGEADRGLRDKKVMSNKVFIVHGHDNEAKQEMARTLEKAGFEAVILHEQADSGLTIIEKIERYTDVAFAVVLYTECDLGREKEADIGSEKYRARQNVVFEHGYLIGKLGRRNVCAIVKGDVDTPGDISGVVYTPMDSNGAWKMQLGKNMKDAGLNVDMNKLCI